MRDLSTVFKAYDVRGIYPDQIDESLCRAIGSAVATFCASPTLLMARDMRPSGTTLTAAFAEGANAVGVDVVDLGMASTDFLYFAAGKLDAPGAMFTASHNPAQYNGIKLCLSGARPIGRDTGLTEIEALTERFLIEPASGGTGDVSTAEMLEDFADHVRSFVDPTNLKPLKVVCDTANGMGGLVAPLVFAGLPFEVEILFPELDGTFPNHPADPIQPENLRDLQAAVLAAGADVGLAFDKFVPREMLKVIAENGGKGVRTQVGHSFIKKVMAETGAVFGGEHSGHYYYRDNYRADSGIITALIVLELMSVSGMSLSEMLVPYQRYVASGEINTEVPDPAAAVDAVAAYIEQNGGTSDRLDGLTVDHGDWWFNLRPSNTEPLLRLNVEAPDEASCSSHVAEVLDLVASLTTP